MKEEPYWWEHARATRRRDTRAAGTHGCSCHRLRLHGVIGGSDTRPRRPFGPRSGSRHTRHRRQFAQWRHAWSCVETIVR